METNYQETLWEIGSWAGDVAEEIYDDLQEHKKQLPRAWPQTAETSLQSRYGGCMDVCRTAESPCPHSGECVLPGFSAIHSAMTGRFKMSAYSVCILPPARYFSATLPNKTRHRAGAVCHCIAGAKALPEVCVLAKPLRQRCNWSINLHRRNWQPM